MNHNHFSIPDHGFDIARDTGVWVSATLLDAAIPYCPCPSSLSFASSTYTGLAQARTGDTSLSASPSYDSSVSTDNLQQTITTPVWSGISPHDGALPRPCAHCSCHRVALMVGSLRQGLGSRFSLIIGTVI